MRKRKVGDTLAQRRLNRADRQRAIDPAVFLAFVQESQPATWEALERLHGGDTAAVVLDDLCKALDGTAGSLGVQRHGFKCFGKRIDAAYFAPAHGMNPDNQRLYAANRLTVTRQLHYSDREPLKSLDLILGLNGIPIATAELKNPLTGPTNRSAPKRKAAHPRRVQCAECL